MASHEDPFLEFEPEPAGPAGRAQARTPERLKPAPDVRWPAPVAAPVPEAAQLRDDLDPWRRADPPPVESARPARRGVSPVLAFAVGIAGLAAAATAFYQLNQALAERTVPIAASPDTPPAANGGDADGLASPTPGPATGDDPASSTPTPSPEPAPEAAPPAAASVPTGFGWVRFDTSLELAVLEGGRTIGSTGAGPVRLPVGIHSLVLVSNAYNVRTPVRVSVTADRTTRTSVLLPMGSVSINALPWAEVWIDGKSVGLTPMANLAVPVGPREIVWRHPQLGERRQTVAVRAKVPVQVGVDFGR